MNFNSEMWQTVGAIMLALIGVASLAVFLSKNSNTSGVITAAFQGVATGLGAAEAPITGASDASLSTSSYG